MPGKKLLVADDSLTIQKVIRLALSNEGYEIQAVSDGNDAIQQISLNRPDVVLIDVSLPGKTAFEVKREINIHEDLHEVRFVLMSSAFEKVDENQADEVQFHGRLTKPFDPAHLRQVLIDALAQVKAKRLEKTSLIQFPPAPPPAHPPLPPPPAFEDEDAFESVPPPLPLDLPSIEPEEEIFGTPPEPPFEVPDQEYLPNEFPDSFPDSFPEPVSIPFENDGDIQKSDEDDFQWSVKEPTLKPPPRMQDRGGSSFELKPHSHPPLPPPPPLAPHLSPSEPEDLLSEDTDSHFMPPPPQMSLEVPLEAPLPITANAISEEQIQDMVREQVEKALQKMIQKSLPDLAEKLIKQEIHRMLSEP